MPVDDRSSLTMTALHTTVKIVLKELDLGIRSYSSSSAYVDYVALAFTFAQPNEDDVELVTRHFASLCEEHDWLHPAVVLLPKASQIMVTLMKNNVISSDGNLRMPA